LDYLSTIIASLIGCDRSDPRVLLSALSVQAQSVMYARNPNPIAERLGFSGKPSRAKIEEAITHIADFSIGGIRQIQKRGHKGSRLKAQGAALE
jgi:hypothetical protein